jgi:hypothetical protein
MQSYAYWPDDHVGSYDCPLFWAMDDAPEGEGQWLG